MMDLSKVPNLIKNSAALKSEINNVEQELGLTLPKVYKDLLKVSNGFSSGGGLVIYGSDDIVERNETWEVKEYAEGFIAIGDDGGGNVYLMSQNEKAEDFLIVDAGEMNPTHASKAPINFIDWINSGCPGMEERNFGFPTDTCMVVVEKVLDNGMKDLIKLKNLLGLEVTTSQLMYGSKNTPYVLASDFPYGKAKKLVEKLDSNNLVIKLTFMN
ncbi:SMI1/KNR4 family protein [Sutcliffiella horikoshii]|uniref:SMI1/KNR4 family protein n=1 Tax=Sutcliffiella horikoshii TaxID=79883 RepID=UPI00384E3953